MLSNACASPARVSKRLPCALLALALATGPAALAETTDEDTPGDLTQRVLQTLSQTANDEDANNDEARDSDTSAARDTNSDSNSDSDREAADAPPASRPANANNDDASSPRLSPVFRSVSPVRSRPAETTRNTTDRAPSEASDAQAAANRPLTTADQAHPPQRPQPADDTANANDDDALSRVTVQQSDRNAPRRARTADDSPAYRQYTIRQGDTFSAIARRTFGDEKKWVAIAEANPRIDPAKLRVGQTIRLPDPERYEAERERQLARVAAAVARARRANQPDSPATRDNDTAANNDDDATTVTVSSGDTLSHIARRVYGRATQWRPIFEANRDQLESPDDLEVGMKLRIPPRPES